MTRIFMSILLFVVGCAGCTKAAPVTVLSERYDICARIAAQVDQAGGGVEDTDITKIVIDGAPITVRISSFPDQRVLNLATRNRFAGHNLSPDVVLLFDLYDKSTMRRIVGVNSTHGRHGRLYVDLEVDMRQGHANSVSKLSGAIYKCEVR